MTLVRAIFSSSGNSNLTHEKLLNNKEEKFIKKDFLVLSKRTFVLCVCERTFYVVMFFFNALHVIFLILVTWLQQLYICIAVKRTNQQNQTNL